MNITKALYTIVGCLVIMLLASAFLQSSQGKSFTDQNAAAYGIASLFSKNQSIISTFPFSNVSNEKSVGVISDAPASTTTPVPPGMFPGIICKDSGCDIGTSNPITISNPGVLDWDGTWPESMQELFKQAKEKRNSLRQWLDSKCNEPGCVRLENGPHVSVRLKPQLPGSCSVNNTRSFVFTSIKTSSSSCADAEQQALSDIGTQMKDIPNTCPDCGYSWTLSNIQTSCQTIPPPPSTQYKATITVDATVSCSGVAGGDYYLGWIEWSACYCCKATTPPASPPVVTPVSSSGGFGQILQRQGHSLQIAN